MTEPFPYAQEAQAPAYFKGTNIVIHVRERTKEALLIRAVTPAEGGGFIPQVWIAGTNEHWDWGPVADLDRAWEIAAELYDHILADAQDRDTMTTMRESLP